MVEYIGLRAKTERSTQIEAAAYFALMTAEPSATFRREVNEFIYQAKAAGLWSFILGLWLPCADTSQAGLLSVIADTPRNATLTGVPTHTPLKGFSGFDASKGVTFPITSTILADDGVYAFGAYRGAGTTANAGDVITADGASAKYQVPGGITWGNQSIGSIFGNAYGFMLGGFGCPVAVNTFIGGSKGTNLITPGQIDRNGDSTTTLAARSSNYRTALRASHPLTRLSAYGFLAHTATDVQSRKFITLLAAFLNNIGALD